MPHPNKEDCSERGMKVEKVKDSNDQTTNLFLTQVFFPSVFLLFKKKKGEGEIELIKLSDNELLKFKNAYLWLLAPKILIE